MPAGRLSSSHLILRWVDYLSHFTQEVFQAFWQSDLEQVSFPLLLSSAGSGGRDSSDGLWGKMEEMKYLDGGTALGVDTAAIPEGSSSVTMDPAYGEGSGSARAASPATPP